MKEAMLERSLTVRLPVSLSRRLRSLARASGRTPSAIVRAALERELDTGTAAGSPTAWERSRRWVGAVRSTEVAPGSQVRRELESWESDRRG